MKTCSQCNKQLRSKDEEMYELCYECAEQFENAGQACQLHRIRLWKESQLSDNPLPKASKVIDNVIKNSLKIYCRKNDYKTKGRDFWKETEQYIWCANVQGSWTSNMLQGLFYINLGIFYKQLNDLSYYKLKSKHPKYHACHIITRLESLIPDLNNVGWEVSCWMTEEEQLSIANDLTKQFIEYGEVWFKENSSSEAADKIKETRKEVIP